MSKRSTEFKKELKALLVKYNASIDFSVGECSDTHGLHGEKLEVSFSEKVKPDSNWTTVVETCTLADGWCVDKSEL